MTVASLETRLKRVEEAQARAAYRPQATKAERDAHAAAELTRPGAEAQAYATLEAERHPAIQERSRAVIEAFWRADT